MKKIIPCLLIIWVMGCTGTTKKETPSMPGAYKMLSQAIKGGSTDTTYYILKQLKIFTDDYMMYANVNPTDSVAAFGVGSYSADTGTIMEFIIFSAGGSTSNPKPTDYKLMVEKTEKGFRQVIPEMVTQGQKIKLTEEYERVGTEAKSPLDGAWVEIKGYSIKGNDTTAEERKLFKAFYAGHFVVGVFSKDSTQKSHTSVASGTFTMDGPNKLKETIVTTNIFSLAGQELNFDNEMTGTDESKQTYVGSDGIKHVSVYMRLKK